MKKSPAVGRSTPRHWIGSGAAAVLSLALAGGQPAWADPPLGPYQGWQWSSGVLATPTSVEEEYCSGEMLFDFAPDLNWSVAGPDEACWGRVTTASSRTLFGFPLSGEAYEAQSTRALENAGGNLYEVYGENLEEGVGDGEQRFATLLMEPSGGDLAIIGQHGRLSESGSHGLSQAIDFAVSATPEVVEARTTADLEGTSWRILAFGQRPSPQSVSNELSGAAMWTLHLQEDGTCAYSLSSVFPEFQKNGDSHLYFQTSIAADLSNRIVRGGVSGGEFQTCSYTIDADGYLAVTSPRVLDPPAIGSQVLLPRLAVSDDEQYLVLAPGAGTIATDPQTLSLGYRVAPDMAPSAIDGDFLVHLSQFEYAATGTASASGNTGSQEFDTRGRGLLRFDSSVPSATPAGESGEWYSCDADLAIDSIEVGYTGNVAVGNVAIGADLASESFVPDICAFQLAFDGALRVHVARDRPGTDDDFAATLRGYVNRTEEVLALILAQAEPIEPRTQGDRDNASLLALVGMRYTGDVDGNEDGDSLTNLEEFQYPLPPAAGTPGCADGPLPIVCALPDTNADGSPDLAVVREGSTRAEIRDGEQGTLIRTLSFLSDAFTPAAAAVLPDTDGDAVPELAVLAVRNSDSRVIAQIRNLDGSGTTRQVWFASGHVPLAIALVEGDADDDGVPELAVLSTRNSDGRGVVEVKNANGAANAKSFWAPVGFAPQDLEIVADADDNGVPDVALLATRITDGRNLVQVSNADGTGTPYSLWFALGQTAIDLAVVPDKDADGIPEIAVLSSRNSDGRVLVELRNAAGAPNPFAIWLAAGFSGIALDAVQPADGSPVPEVAVLAKRNSDGRILVSLRNAFGADTPRSVWYTVGYTARGLTIFPDVDGNGIDETGVLMTRDSDERILVQTRNTLDAPDPRSYWFSP